MPRASADQVAQVEPHAATGAAEAAHGAPVADAAHAAAGGHEASGGFPPFDAALFSGQLFWFAITFGVLYFVLSRLVLPQISAVLANRAGTIASDVDNAQAKTAAAEKAREAMEKAVAKARADARKLIDDVRGKEQAKLAAEQAEADTRLAARAQEAETKINAARTKALADVDQIAASLATEVADKLLPASATASPGGGGGALSMADGETR